jgi:hypothetical protein
VDSQLDKFFGAWCAPELRLLGYRLKRPFCLGMALLLEAIESPFARLWDPELEITAAGVVTALRICSEARWPFDHVDLRPTAWTRWQAWRLRRPDRRLEVAAELARWMAACSGRPEYWNEKGEDRSATLTAPPLLCLASSLLRRTTLKEDRVWSMPLGLVHWYHGTIAEQEGEKLRFYYDSDLEAAERAPDLTKLSEDELFEVVAKDRGREFADQFFKTRKEALHGSRN